jgi:hypothetical protein
MIIKTGKCEIKLDKESIAALLGLPRGRGIDISRSDNTAKKSSDYVTWRRRYGLRDFLQLR